MINTHGPTVIAVRVVRLGLLCMGFLAALGQAQTVEWAISAGGEPDDEATAIAVDAAGNSYLTGHFGRTFDVGTATFGPFTLTSVWDFDVFVVKCDASGTVLWARSDGGGGIDLGEGIAVDAAGNSYVTGSYSEGAATFGAFTLPSPGFSSAMFVAKYDASGTVVWAKSAMGNFKPVLGEAIAVDAAGNTYVTGSFQAAATFDTVTLTSLGSSVKFQAFVTKYDPSGNVVWARLGGSTDHVFGKGIAVDAAGNSHVTGSFNNTTATFGPFTLTSAGSFDIFVVKYDSDGNELWARSAGSSGVDLAGGIAVDAAGNSYATGKFDGVIFLGPFIINGDNDMYLIRYDSSGNVVWATSAGGDFDPIEGRSIAVDADGNSYVTGVFENSVSFQFTFPLASAGVMDVFVVKYDSSGAALWATSDGGSGFDLGDAIGVDAAGNAFVTGSFDDAATFGTFSLFPTGPFVNFEVFLAKYSSPVPCGNGALDPGEECDDGNTDDSDGCSSTCTVEFGWECSGQPSVCTPPSIPTVSQWGITLMAMMILTAGTVLFRGRAGAADREV